MRKIEPWRDARPIPTIPSLTRRESLIGFLPAFAVFAFVDHTAAFAKGVSRTSPARWVDRQNEIALALAAGKMTPLNWMHEVERLAAEVDVSELMDTVNRSRLTSAGEPSHNDPRKRFVRFLDAADEPRQQAYGAALCSISRRTT
jgi:hypothetical protein